MAARLLIEMDDAGNMRASWPKDRVLAYGMLEAAKDIIRAHEAKQGLERVVPAVVIPDLGGNGRQRG